MPSKALRKHKTLQRSVAGQKDLVRVAPYRATWVCRCGYMNVVYFKKELIIGHVFPERIKCLSCPLEYRGRYITAPAVTMPGDLFEAEPTTRTA